MIDIMPTWTLQHALQSTSLIQFVNDFTTSVQGKQVEYLWTWLSNGELIKISGDNNSVKQPDIQGMEMVIAEIHNHPINLNSTERRECFLHCGDILGSYNSSNRIFGIHIVFVDAPGYPYLVATKFNGEALGNLFDGVKKPYKRVRGIIERTHAHPEKHAALIDQTMTIGEMKKIFEDLLPDLDFAVFKMGDKGKFVYIT